MRRRFAQVDVFTQTRYRGNPVAVVVDADGLSDEQMQSFAVWTNLSETTFLLQPTKPGADYRVRIFTPSEELPFAGHPTLGTCHAWLRSAINGASRLDRTRDVVQECAAGLVRVRREEGRLAFAAPPLRRSGPVDEADVARVAQALRIDRADVLDAVHADNGPPWVAVRLRDADAVLALRPGSVGDLYVGVVGAYPEGSPEAVEVRAFCPGGGDVTMEDPVTGSLNAAIAPWLESTGVVTYPYVASQGTLLGRAGRAHLARDDEGTVWVGGTTITCIDGFVEL
ncbi:MAG: PhzF family phenazine biosynthesis protein [Actinobacteria bacterium]|nr:PhzF family phenazine biosynthesis protein [Actinomycetota bacterium]